MTPRKFLVTSIPAVAMITVCLILPGIERWLSAFGTTDQAKLFLGRIGLALLDPVYYPTRARDRCVGPAKLSKLIGPP